MENTKKIHDPVKTKQLIKDTFTALLERKPYDEISVSELTRAAGINRVTFYSHFTNIDELMAEIETDLADQILKTQADLFQSADFHDKAANLFLDYFLSDPQIGILFVSEHTTGAGLRRIHDHLQGVCKAEWRKHLHGTEDSLDRLYEFYYAGAIAFLKQWYKTGFSDNVEQVRNEYMQITTHFIRYIFGNSLPSSQTSKT